MCADGANGSVGSKFGQQCARYHRRGAIEGDQALLEFTQRFDQHPADSVSELVFEGDT